VERPFDTLRAGSAVSRFGYAKSETALEEMLFELRASHTSPDYGFVARCALTGADTSRGSSGMTIQAMM